MIRDMRRGHVPSVERLRSLCQVLDLDFFVGPRRLRREAREGAPDVLLSTLEHTAQDLAQLTADAGGNPVSDDLWPVLAARRAAAFPPPEIDVTAGGLGSLVAKSALAVIQKPNMEFSRFLVHTGETSEEYEDPGSKDKTALKMRGRDINLNDCFLVEIQDEAMIPTLPKGSVVLVDGESTDWQPPRILAVLIDDDVIARRAALGEDGQPLLASSHHYWPDTPLPAGAKVLGEVRWVANWLSRAAPANDQVENAPTLTPSEDKGKKTE